MKRSLTIGCVLLVGGGVTNCGGNADMGSVPREEQGEQAGASGSGAGGQGFVGDVVGNYYAGAGGGAVGVPVEVGGGPPSTGPYLGTTAGEGSVGYSGAGGWEEAGAAPTAGEGGVSGATDAPPAVGVAPHGGTGGWVGIPPK